MEDLPVYYDHIHGVYRLVEDDNDSGVEELPFSSYIKLEGDVGVQTASASQNSNGFADSHFELDEYDLTYMDDITDGDYTPYQSGHLHKKGKSKYMRHHMQQSSEHSGLMMMTPEKQMGLSRELGTCFDTIRHYARKDRTPRTILKMMERHRESERVRHHTLNESMKDVCLRVPGYDPDVKETKVIQMQRIIGYECFLENTLASLCEQLNMPVKVLKLSTNFITDAMRDTPIEDFYTPSNYKTSDLDDDEDDDESVPQQQNKCPTRCRVINASSMDKSIIRYRRDKVSSPTIDSTTDDVKIFPLHEMQTMTRKQLPRQRQWGSWTGQGFTCIEPSHTVLSSQESGIKMETQSSQGDETTFRDIDSLIEHGLCHDPEHLKTVTASFMAEELASPSTSADESDGFTLASPKHDTENDFIFLRSPRRKGIWHHSSTPQSDMFDTPSSREMQTVSPENILETMPKSMEAYDQSSEVCPASASFHVPLIDVVNIKKERDTENFESYNSGFHECYTNVTMGGSNHSDLVQKQKRSFYEAQGHFVSSQPNGSSPQGKNKRKRYTPLRSPLSSITNCASDNEEECAVPKYKRLPSSDPVMTENFVTRSGLERKNSNNKSKSVTGCEENQRPKVDHRRSTWMNGFMMFCQKNRAELVRGNPGVHNSHIQKMLGHLWRNMSAEEQEPYRASARQCSNYLKKVHDSLLNDFTESIVDAGTTVKE